ncbi:MAG: sodium:alanine symporter family protein, partial [Oscillospiraceae bacterium]|nr:sodium:alanine symporter family protein [Oscillospiraceae bacterium]
MTFEKVLENISSAVWGIPLIVLIIACGVWLTVRTRGLQVRYLGRALKYMVQNEEGGDGDVSSFGALCTALSATIGTGNIVGVASAIHAGGFGAIFWMWVSAAVAAVLKYAEIVLAMRHRVPSGTGFKGGAPYYI